MNIQKRSYEDVRPPVGYNKRVSLDLCTGRCRSRFIPTSGLKIGDVITFPSDESELHIFERVGQNPGLYSRVILVEKNWDYYYFPIAMLYNDTRDKNGILVPKMFRDLLYGLESDADIIRTLLGHSVKCIEGAEYWRSGDVISEKNPVVFHHIIDFVLLDPPLMKDNLWYEQDTCPLKVVSEDYIHLSNMINAFVYEGFDSMRDYLKTHHGVPENAQIGFFFENGFKLDEDGLINTPIAVKDENEKFTILRDVRFGLSPLSLLERKLGSKYNETVVGLPGIRTISALKKLIERDRVILEMSKITFTEPFFRFRPIRVCGDVIKDDIGDLSFPDGECMPFLRMASVPAHIKDRAYTLVGVNYRAPYSLTRGQHCILVAQVENEYDGKAVEVCRWFPSKISSFTVNGVLQWEKEVIGEGIYEWGFVSRQENSDLHDYMASSGSWILFGQTDNLGRIRILGGIEQFVEGALRGYAIPQSILKLVP